MAKIVSFYIYEVYRTGRSLETESRMEVLSGARLRGDGKLLFNGYKFSA